MNFPLPSLPRFCRRLAVRPARYQLTGVLLVWALAVSGCSDSRPVAAPSKPSHEHEHEHEHHADRSRPATFVQAVERLTQLIEAGPEANSTQASASDARTIQEMQTLWRWLPELAADTDLPEAEWNQVDEFAIDAQEALTRAIRQGQVADSTWREWQRELPRLQALSRQSERGPSKVTDSTSPSASSGSEPEPTDSMTRNQEDPS